MNKKTLTIIGIITGLVIIGLVIFFFTKSPDTGEPYGQGIISYFFPPAGDKPVPTLPPPIAGPPGIVPVIPGLKTGALVQLTRTAISSPAVFHKESQKIRYIEKSTGHIYEIKPQGENKNRLSNTTIPKTFETIWSYNANQAVLRYFESDEKSIMDAIRNFSVFSVSTTTDGDSEGIFLPSNTSSLASSPEENKIFYLIKSDETLGIVSSFENKEPKQIFSNPFGEFLVSWPQKNIITLLTKPSALSKGYFYKLNPKTGSFEKILGGIKGLMALHSPINNKVLYSNYIYDAEEKTTLGFPLSTLSEKCIWSKLDENKIYCAVPTPLPQAVYPDDWYKGLISFDDALWQIDIANGSIEMLFGASEFDMINLFTDTEENYLFFQNKKDSTLWSLRLKS